jgi:polyhydroxyalkanoate synthesis regulator protein
VLDKRNGNDITRSILLQVIAEDEQRREPIMSRAFLSQVIRAPGRIPAVAIAAYLEQCLDSYVNRERPVAHVHRGRWNALHEDGSGCSTGEAEARCETFAEDRKKAG